MFINELESKESVLDSGGGTSLALGSEEAGGTSMLDSSEVKEECEARDGWGDGV